MFQDISESNMFHNALKIATQGYSHELRICSNDFLNSSDKDDLLEADTEVYASFLKLKEIIKHNLLPIKEGSVALALSRVPSSSLTRDAKDLKRKLEKNLEKNKVEVPSYIKNHSLANVIYTSTYKAQMSIHLKN